MFIEMSQLNSPTSDDCILFFNPSFNKVNWMNTGMTLSFGIYTSLSRNVEHFLIGGGRSLCGALKDCRICSKLELIPAQKSLASRGSVGIPLVKFDDS